MIVGVAGSVTTPGIRRAGLHGEKSIADLSEAGRLMSTRVSSYRPSAAIPTMHPIEGRDLVVAGLMQLGQQPE